MRPRSRRQPPTSVDISPDLLGRVRRFAKREQRPLTYVLNEVLGRAMDRVEHPLGSRCVVEFDAGHYIVSFRIPGFDPLPSDLIDEIDRVLAALAKEKFR
jgi:hypothetical protein